MEDHLIDRLDALKQAGVIAGYEAPHPNRGLAGGMLPWVVMPASEGPASLYRTERELGVALGVLERFGATDFAGLRRAA